VKSSGLVTSLFNMWKGGGKFVLVFYYKSFGKIKELRAIENAGFIYILCDLWETLAGIILRRLRYIERML
jgi:cation transporter-like permease